jgi:hypothetical protein
VRAAIALLPVGVVAASLWYVVAPPRDASAYRDRASESAQTLRSQVQTAKIWAQAVADGKALGRSAAVGLDDNEKQAQAAASRFSAYDPPRGTDDVRSEFTSLASAVTDELARLRIAAQRGDWDEVRRAPPRLDRLAAQLGKFRQALAR